MIVLFLCLSIIKILAPFLFQNKFLNDLCHAIFLTASFRYVIRSSLHMRLAVFHCNAKPCLQDHGKIIITVTNGNRFGKWHICLLRSRSQCIALAYAFFHQLQIGFRGIKQIKDIPCLFSLLNVNYKSVIVTSLRLYIKCIIPRLFRNE